VCGGGNTVETGNGKVAPNHQSVLPQFAHRAEGDDVVVAYRRGGPRIHGQRLADAVASTLARERDIDEPLRCNRQIVLPHGPFIACAPEVVHGAAADAAEEGYATVALVDKMTAGLKRAPFVVCSDEVVTANRRLPYDDHQRNAGMSRSLEQRLGSIECRTQDDSRRMIFMHGCEHLVLNVQPFIRVCHHADVTRIGQLAFHADQHFSEERIAQIVDDDTDHVRRFPPQVGGAPVVHIAKRGDAFAHPLRCFGRNEGTTLKDQRDGGF